jgi:hypothetical protein
MGGGSVARECIWFCYSVVVTTALMVALARGPPAVAPLTSPCPAPVPCPLPAPVPSTSTALVVWRCPDAPPISLRQAALWGWGAGCPDLQQHCQRYPRFGDVPAAEWQRELPRCEGGGRCAVGFDRVLYEGERYRNRRYYWETLRPKLVNSTVRAHAHTPRVCLCVAAVLM